VRGEPLPEDAGDDDGQEEIRCDRAEPDVERPVGGKERNDRIDNVHSLREDLGHDVNDKECQRAE
jgi:hypothetical protein